MCGMMAESMKGSIKMIKNMALEFILGQMEDAMKDFGTKENNMVWVHMLFLKKIN
jgi:hypothetical protein